MRFVLASIRVIGLLGVCLVSVAIGLGRWATHSGLYSGAQSGMTPTRYVEIMECTPGASEAECRLLDPERCRLVSFRIPKNDVLYCASSSPWEDDKGELQVVGRWVRRDPELDENSEHGIGLARYRFPSGDPLDYVELRVLPAGNPCWFPERVPRVLFVGLDGSLYTYEFEKDRGPRSSVESTKASPRPLTWRCPKPGDGRVRVTDATWPTDPRLGGKLIVSLIQVDPTRRGLSRILSEVWWLKLNREGTAIIAAGPLIEAANNGNPPSEKRMPNVFNTPDGGLAIAYLNRPAGDRSWQLQVVRLDLQAAGGVSLAKQSGTTLVADGLASNFLAASSNGRWLYAVQAHEMGSETRRYSVTKALVPQRPHAVTSSAAAARTRESDRATPTSGRLGSAG